MSLFNTPLQKTIDPHKIEKAYYMPSAVSKHIHHRDTHVYIYTVILSVAEEKTEIDGRRARLRVPQG